MAQGFTVKVIALELPPPGARVNTVTLTFLGLGPGFAEMISPAGIVAVSCVALTKIVALSLPSHRTTEHGAKELPFTVNVNVGEPAVTAVCDKEVMLGRGRPVGGVVRVKGSKLDGADPDGFVTITGTVPGNAASAGEIAAES